MYLFARLLTEIILIRIFHSFQSDIGIYATVQFYDIYRLFVTTVSVLYHIVYIENPSIFLRIDFFDCVKSVRQNTATAKAEADKQARIDRLTAELEELKKDE